MLRRSMVRALALWARLPALGARSGRAPAARPQAPVLCGRGKRPFEFPILSFCATRKCALRRGIIRHGIDRRSTTMRSKSRLSLMPDDAVPENPACGGA